MRRNVPDQKNPYFCLKWSRATFVLGAEVSNARAITITLLRPDGKPFKLPANVRFYLSSAADGIAVASAASSEFTFDAGSGFIPGVVGRSGAFNTNTSGVTVLTINDTAVRTVYLVLVKPAGGLLISPAIAFA